MIPTVQLEGSGLRISRLALGLSRLHRMDSGRARQDLLAAAADLGFRHFDIARSYGDGIGEVELGRFARGRRSEITLATKFGFTANALVERLPSLQTPVAAARVAMKKLGYRERRRSFTAALLQASLERSLRAMGVETIDILFMHEPSADLVPHPDELRAAAERFKKDGKIRFFGVSGEYAPSVAVARLVAPVADVLQVAETTWPSGAPVPHLTYAAMRSGGQSRFEQPLDERAALAHLRAALQRRPSGAVVVSSRHVEHLRRLAEVAGGVS